MNWRNLDLNLLVVFNAVAQERSATRAAAKLNMTQPAISHALNRLRSALRDDLFVRTPEGMEPTPHAEWLIGPVRAALESLHSALDSAAAFDPATTEHDFAIALDNRGALVLAPPVAAAVAAEAPGVTLDMRPSGTLDLAERLDRGGTRRRDRRSRRPRRAFLGSPTFRRGICCFGAAWPPGRCRRCTGHRSARRLSAPCIVVDP
jgi:DNA-binding transcriptional LysR family regulator